MRDLHNRRHAVQHDDLVAPVELVGLARREGQRRMGVRRRARALLAPRDHIAANRGVAAGITGGDKLLVNPNERQSLPRRSALVLFQERFKPLSPRTNPRLRPPRSLVMELGRIRADDLPHDLARNPQLSADLLDRLAKGKVRPAYLGDRLHNQHSNPRPPNLEGQRGPDPRGPDRMQINPAGSLFHEKMTNSNGSAGRDRIPERTPINLFHSHRP